MRIVDLSVAIEHQQPTDPPVQQAQITYIDHSDVESMLSFFPGAAQSDLPDGCGWAVENMYLSTHTGTHLDAPWHYHPTMDGGKPAWTIDEVPLEWCIGNGVMIDFSDKADGYVCTAQDLIDYLKKINYTLQLGDIVLVYTSAMRNWGSAEYMASGCGIGREATLWLVEQGVRVVGTDAWSWDAPLALTAKRYAETGDASIIWEGHKAGKDMIYCHLEKLTNLEQLPPYGFKVIALPVKIKKASAGWVRAIAILND